MMRTAVFLVLVGSGAAALTSCKAGEACNCDSGPCQIICDKEQQCSDASMMCGGGSCHLDCTGVHACNASHIQCHAEGTCHMRCANKGSCDMLRPAAGASKLDSSYPPSMDQYGMSCAKQADICKLIMDGELAFANNDALCLSKECDNFCNGFQACKNSTFVCRGESCKHSCNNVASCVGAQFEFVNGTTELRCANVESCKGASVRCPEGDDCKVVCSSRDSCKDLEMWCPTGQTCILECGDQACQIPDSNLHGDINVVGQRGLLPTKTVILPTKTVVTVPTATVVPTRRQIVLKEITRFVLNIAKALFNGGNFEKVVKETLGKLLSAMRIYWVCPASACDGSKCPSTEAEKLAKGCTAEVQLAQSRGFVMLAGEGTVVEASIVPAGTTSNEEVRKALDAASKDSKSALSQEFKVESVSTHTVEVVELVQDDVEAGVALEAVAATVVSSALVVAFTMF